MRCGTRPSRHPACRRREEQQAAPSGSRRGLTGRRHCHLTAPDPADGQLAKLGQLPPLPPLAAHPPFLPPQSATRCFLTPLLHCPADQAVQEGCQECRYHPQEISRPRGDAGHEGAALPLHYLLWRASSLEACVCSLHWCLSSPAVAAPAPACTPGTKRLLPPALPACLPCIGPAPHCIAGPAAQLP